MNLFGFDLADPCKAGALRRERIFGRFALLILCAASGLSGCRDNQFLLVPVSGTVTLDGNPVANARVIFEPRRLGNAARLAGPSSNGLTDDQGRFVLKTTLQDDNGAVIGLHSVSVRTYQAAVDLASDSPRVIRAEEIPARYHEPDAILFEVKAGGTDVADFALTRE